MDRIDLYAPFTKRAKDPETGFLTVSGKITGPQLDRDQQRMDPEWLKTAVPEWFRTGNIREMHQLNAVGKAVGLTQHGDDWYIDALIVDPVSVTKCEAGVLNGFSIGVKQPRVIQRADAPAGACVGGWICETSIVDSPALGSCKLTMAKADAAGDLVEVEAPTLEIIKTAEPAAPATPEEHEVTADEIREILKAELPALIKSELTDALAAITPPEVAPAADPAGDPAPVVDPAGDPVQAAAAPADTSVAPATAPAESSDVVKALAAVTKANEALEARLAKVEAMPTGGGPVVSAPSNAVLPTADSQRTALLAKADAADQAGHSALAQGYRDNAAKIPTP